MAWGDDVSKTTILMVDDARDDVDLVKLMFKRSRILNPIQVVFCWNWNSRSALKRSSFPSRASVNNPRPSPLRPRVSNFVNHPRVIHVELSDNSAVFRTTQACAGPLVKRVAASPDRLKATLLGETIPVR